MRKDLVFPVCEQTASAGRTDQIRLGQNRTDQIKSDLGAKSTSEISWSGSPLVPELYLETGWDQKEYIIIHHRRAY